MSSDNQQPEVMTGESLDISEQRKRELKQLFPGVFTETTNEKGEVVETIDFERLKAELGTFSDIYEGRRERYGMEWPGKRECMRLIQEPSRATLKPVREESIDFDTTQNLFIEGDNLEVLKLLQKSYYGKVKMIYIDPPYNTGNEFIYPDNYTDPLDTYLAYAGLVDDEGKKFSTNTATEGRFHTKWLSMMYPRLYVARNLLREDGVVFISIDDNELQNIRRICDEIFGEENFVTLFVWEKRTNRENRKVVSSRHDYIVCYAKNIITRSPILNPLPMSEQALSRYKNHDNDPRGPWKSDPATAQAGHGTKSQFYTLVAPNGKKHELQSGRCWLYTKEVMEKAIKDGRIWLGKDGNGVPRVKTYLHAKERGLTPESILFAEDASTNEGAKTYLKKLFDGHAVFETPKPVELIEMLLNMAADDGIVLDFFAGSAATAEACYRLGNRFVLVQLPEMCEEGSEAKKCGYDTVSQIAKERIRRSSMKVRSEKDGQLEFGGNEEVDFGFKMFRLDRSNFCQWQIGSPEMNMDDVVKQLELHVDHVNKNVSKEEILYELLVKAGFAPTERVSVLDIEEKEVFSVANGALLIYLDDDLSDELIDAVAELEPMQFICLDKAFKGNDQLKANAVQTFKSRSQNSETEMVFKVV